MKGESWLKWVSIIMVLVALGVGAFAMGSQPAKRFRPERRFEGIAKELGLTPEQKVRFMKAARQVEEEAKVINRKNKELFDKIEKELVKEAPDSKVIYGYMQQIGQNNTQIQFKRMDQIIQLRKELAPEQRTKFEKMMKERKEQEKKMLEKMRQRGGKDRGLGGPEAPPNPPGPGGPMGPGGPEGPEGPLVP
jgi:Spy/CpxP family protein refolding chaperone